MRLNVIIILICLMTTYSQAQVAPAESASNEEKYTIPPLEEVGEGGLLHRQFIYPLGNKPTANAHASTIVETPRGILVAFFAGPNEGSTDVGIRLAKLQEDGNWSWPVEIANGFENDTLRYPTWNPVLFLPQNGDLQLYYKQGPNPDDWWGMVKTSPDHGGSWSYGRRLGEDEAIGHLVGPVKNKPVQLADGTILSPSSTEATTADGDRVWKIHVEISEDGGDSWEVVGPINDGVAFDAIQPSILQFDDGRLMMLARTRQNVIAQSRSSDGGRSWSEVTATNLPNPNSGTDAVTLQDGRQLLIYNHKTTEDGERGRDMLNLAISDDGVSWTPVMTIENEASLHGYAYPALIQTADGLVHATYTYDRKGVKHVVVDPEKL